MDMTYAELRALMTKRPSEEEAAATERLVRRRNPSARAGYESAVARKAREKEMLKAQANKKGQKYEPLSDARQPAPFPLGISTLKEDIVDMGRAQQIRLIGTYADGVERLEKRIARCGMGSPKITVMRGWQKNLKAKRQALRVKWGYKT